MIMKKNSFLVFVYHLYTDFSCVWKKSSAHYATSSRRDHIY